MAGIFDRSGINKGITTGETPAVLGDQEIRVISAAIVDVNGEPMLADNVTAEEITDLLGVEIADITDNGDSTYTVTRTDGMTFILESGSAGESSVHVDGVLVVRPDFVDSTANRGVSFTHDGGNVTAVAGPDNTKQDLNVHYNIPQGGPASDFTMNPGDYVTQGGTTYRYTGVDDERTDLQPRTISAGTTIPTADLNTEQFIETRQHTDISDLPKIATAGQIPPEAPEREVPSAQTVGYLAVWNDSTALAAEEPELLLRNNDVEIYSNLPINTTDLQADTDYNVYIVTRSLTSTATGNNDIAQPSRWYLNDQHPTFVGRPVGETGIMPNAVNSFTLQFNAAAVNNIQNMALVQAQVALDDDNPRADVFANTWAIPPGAGGSSVPFNLPTNNVTNATVTGNGSILTLTRQNADPVVFAPSGPGPTPERLSITPTSQSYIQNDGSQAFTVTIREQGTNPSIAAVTPSSARAGVTFGNPSGLNTGTVTVQVFLSAASTQIAGTFDVHFAVTGEGSGVSYTNHGLNVPVTVQSEWFAGVRTTTPTATTDLTSQGVFHVGDSTQLVGVENGDIYILVPTSNEGTVQFTTANPNIGYDFTNTGVTIGSFSLLTLGETRANSTYTIRIGRV